MQLHAAEVQVISGPLMPTVGTFLRQLRESKSLSVEEVSRATRVPAQSVERIEADRFDELPGEVFVRGFLKSYARCLGVPPEEVMARYNREPPCCLGHSPASLERSQARAHAPLRGRHRLRALAHLVHARAQHRAQAPRGRHASRAVPHAAFGHHKLGAVHARRTSSQARIALALLLRRVEYGESDLVVTLLTDTVGRISALARGARKSVKRFGGVLEPMHTLQIAYDDRSGAELVVLREAKLARARPFLVTQLERMQAAGQALNWVRKAAPPRTPEPEVWAAMQALLDQLDDPNDELSPRTRLAGQRGCVCFRPSVGGIDFERCVGCGKVANAGQAAAVDAARGGLVCRACGGARRRVSGAERARFHAAASGGALDDDSAALALELVDQALKAHGGIE